MDINLPLILFFLVAGTGAIWLFDIFMLRSTRNQAINTVNTKFASLSDSERETDQAYLSAHEAASKEPMLVEYAKSFFPVLTIVFVLRSFIIEPFQIPSGSMIPTLEIGDYIAVNKFAYGIRLPVLRTKVIDVSKPKRGDVVVFFPPNEKRYFIKRLIGLPGDKISYVNHQLYVNDVPMPQKAVEHVTHNPEGKSQNCFGYAGKYSVVEEMINDRAHLMQKCSVPGSLSRKGHWEVPVGHYFMMGDNRDHSSDSRAWGVVPEENLVGKAFAIWMHWQEVSSIPSFARTSLIK